MSDKQSSDVVAGAEVVLPAGDLPATVRFFIDELGFRMDSIAPADDPAVAQLSGHGLHLRLDSQFRGETATLRMGTAGQESRPAIIAPNGTRIEFGPASPVMKLPPLKPSLCIQRLDCSAAAWQVGRAGMQYRDLIPDRQGGRFIASHIRIPQGGPVPDNVHFHDIRVQIIYCYRGWVRLAYEDQGEPFVMRAGDCVLQPPLIRHRVLEASDGLEVIEISSPAEHITHLDHDMMLPTGRHLPHRDYGGQRYTFHQAGAADWSTEDGGTFAVRDLGIGEATRGLAGGRVLRHTRSSQDAELSAHDKEFVFAFILQGSLVLLIAGRPEVKAGEGDSFVIPAGVRHGFKDCSEELQLLEVCLPAWMAASADLPVSPASAS